MILLSAVEYRKTLLSGHSCPCLIDGVTVDDERHEVVIKLRQSVQGGAIGLACELVAAQLAAELGLSVPQSFLVEVTQEFVESVSDAEARARFQANLGWHFASANLSGPWHAVPFSESLPSKLVDPAAAVLAFDALVRNDDRHIEKSNYLIKGRTIMVIDHERAFPRAHLELGPSPWEPGGLDFIRRHVFFAGLRGQLPDFEPVPAAMEALSAEKVSAIVAAIPPNWDAGPISALLESYLLDLRQNFRSVIRSLKTMLQ